MSLSFIRRTLYSLNRRYGATADLYRNVSSSVNNETGVTTTVRSKVRVRRMIRMPDDRSRKFAQDIAYLAANKNFTYGGTWDENSRTFVIPADQLTAGFVPTNGDWIVMDSKRYDIKKVQELDFHQGYILEGAAVEGDALHETHELTVEHDLAVEQEATLEP